MPVGFADVMVSSLKAGIRAGQPQGPHSSGGRLRTSSTRKVSHRALGRLTQRRAAFVTLHRLCELEPVWIRRHPPSYPLLNFRVRLPAPPFTACLLKVTAPA